MKPQPVLYSLFLLLCWPYVSFAEQSLPEQQLESAKAVLDSAKNCVKLNTHSQQATLQCLSDYAKLRSKTKQKRLIKWLSQIQIINLLPCNGTEIQMAQRKTMQVPVGAHLSFCLHYYQTPFQRTSMVTFAIAESKTPWKIIAINEL